MQSAANTLALTEQAATEVHSTVAGHATSLKSILDRTRAGGRPATGEWLIPVTPRTVHCLEGLRRFALDHEIRVRFSEPRELSVAEAIFWSDFDESVNPARRKGPPLWSLAGELWDCLRHHGYAAKKENVSVDAIERAVLIGAYGGEHLGDAAILGGVVQSLYKQCGTRQICLLSHRPDHTQNLVGTLSLPIDVRVRRYTMTSARDELRAGDGLVMAGGPLMDLPRVLIKHWTAASIARSQGKPFLIDRVGLGPFRRNISRKLARRILVQADRITLRASAALDHPLMAGLRAEALPDPAFAYFEANSDFGNLPDGDRAAVDSLLTGAAPQSFIGLNLRPIRHEWCPEGEEVSRRAYQRFLERLSEGLIRLSSESAGPLTYIYFPMNPMQMGQSDLASAYELQSLVRGRVDLRVWEGDPSVDGVRYLLSKMRAALTMRFHACIFAAAAGVGTLGIDYYPAMGGKVLELFADLGRKEDACRIDQFECDWFVRKMQSKLEG